MALQQTVTISGIELTDAYIKIRHIGGNKVKLSISVEVYASKTIADLCMTTNTGWLSATNYYITPSLESSDNFLKQGYTYLKTLPEYEDATDV